MTIRVRLLQLACVCVGNVLFASSGAIAQVQYAPRTKAVGPRTSTFDHAVIQDFAGQGNNLSPAWGSLIEAQDGNYYGVTSGMTNGNFTTGGAIFKVSPTGTLTTLYVFCKAGGTCTDGETPVALIQGGDGNFYGVTLYGGNSYQAGTIFKFAPSGTLTTLYSFCTSSKCPDGSAPLSLIQGSDGNFYGATEIGGLQTGGYPCVDIGCGTVFKITPDGNFTSLHSFCAEDGNCPNGAQPTPGLVQSTDGNFYGSGQYGGNAVSSSHCGGSTAAGCGVLYKITPAGTYTLLYAFCAAGGSCIDGQYPGGVLAQGTDGNFYGGTEEGGKAWTDGTLFKITPGGVLTTLYSFCTSVACPDGANPYTGLMEGSDGNYYGSTIGGGLQPNDDDNFGGTVFQITSSGSLTQLYTFCESWEPYGTGNGFNCLDGQLPDAPLLQGSNGIFYGSTYMGGTGLWGTLFTMSGTPALAGPVQLSLNNSSVDAGSPVTLSWRVANGSSLTLEQCYAFVQGGYAAAGEWSGLQTGALTDGVYSGSATITPTDGGMYTYALTCGGMESGFATLTVDGGTLTVTTTSLPTAYASAAYSQALVAQGGTPPYSWSLSSGSLPAGLTLSSGGVLSGTPTTVGNYSFVVQAKDSALSPATAKGTVMMTVNPALAISPASLASAVVNTSYSQTFTAIGGTPPYSWVTASGILPTGISLNETTGVFSGTPIVIGTTNFSIQVFDSESPPLVTTIPLTFAVNSQALTITTSSLQSATVGTSYSQTLTATGGVTPYTWSISSGALPLGLTLNVTTGLISGTPTTVETSPITVTLNDSDSDTASANLSLPVLAALIVTTTSFPNGVVSVPYAQTLSGAGGTPPYTWSLTAGNLPAGLSLSASTGLISGTPTSAATSNFTMTLTDSADYVASANLSIGIASNSLVITTTRLPSGAEGRKYATQLQATGGSLPYTWSVTSGSLPPGLNLNAARGTISGDPTATGTYDFTVEVTDRASHTASTSLSIFICGSSQVTSTSTSLSAGTTGAAYSTTLTATSGTPPYTWSMLSGSLPPGLTLASTGVISGTPTTAATSPFMVQVEDSASDTATASLSITVILALQVSTVLLPTGAESSAYSAGLTAAGGPSVRKWSLRSGSLPAGLTLSASTGAISGTPTATGTSSFTVEVAAGGYTATANLSITVNASSAVRVTTSSLAGGTVGTSYSETVAATGGTSPYTWSVYSGSLPPGMTLNTSTGVISGTPSTIGTSDFFIAVKDSGNNAATSSLSITVTQ